MALFKKKEKKESTNAKVGEIPEDDGKKDICVIGHDSEIPAGAVVTKSCEKEGSVLVGVPAKVINN